MIRLLKKLGFGETLSAIIMVVAGVLIVLQPNLLGYLVAAYLIVIGLLKLFFPERK